MKLADYNEKLINEVHGVRCRVLVDLHAVFGHRLGPFEPCIVVTVVVEGQAGTELKSSSYVLVLCFTPVFSLILTNRPLVNFNLLVFEFLVNLVKDFVEFLNRLPGHKVENVSFFLAAGQSVVGQVADLVLVNTADADCRYLNWQLASLNSYLSLEIDFKGAVS
jgi:hypothetical protein